MEHESLSAEIVKLQIINTKFKARITELEAQIRDAGDYAEKLQIECSELEARLKQAEAENIQLSAAVEETVHIAPDDLLFTMRVRAEKAEADAGRLKRELDVAKRGNRRLWDENEKLRGVLEKAQPIVDAHYEEYYQGAGVDIRPEMQAALSPAEQADDEKGVKG